MDLGVLAVVLAAEGEEKNPLVPNIAEIVWGLLAFLVFFAFFLKYVVPRAQQTLHERTDRIEGELQRAHDEREEAQRLLAEYREQLGEARSEAARIRTEAQSQRQQMIDEAREEAQREAQRVSERAQEQIRSERDQAAAELRSDVGALAVDLASRVVGESLEDEERRRRTVERFLSEVEERAERGSSEREPAGQA